MRKNTKTRSRQKPAKPYPDFPLFAHATGRWAKKIRGKLHYFGPWNDADAALQLYLDQRDDLHAGRRPRLTGGVTVRDTVNRFLTSKSRLMKNHELTQRTFDDYVRTCDRLVEAFGKNRSVDDLHSDDFEELRTRMAQTLGPVALGNEIQRVRSVFRFAYESGMVDSPIRFGPGFKRPSRKTLRVARAEKGERMFEAAEICEMLKASSPQLGAMILLGVNCGFGNHDCGSLPVTALDLDQGWVNFHRPKTGITRRCPLWPETVTALHEALDSRPLPKDDDHADLVFITKYGQPWAKETSDSPVSNEMTKLLKDLKLHRPGLGFYALRHTFETIAGESRDQIAVDHIMGHVRDDMASVYRERISDERLRAVVDHVHGWLWPPK